MIAEKTADAIKGRKLAPFEPPTKLAGNHQRYRQQQQHQQAYLQQQVYHQRKPTLQYPPPIAQTAFTRQQLQRSLLELTGNFTAANNKYNHLFATTTSTSTNEIDDHFINGNMNNKQTTSALHHPDISMLNKYSRSSVAENLLSKIGSIR